MFPESMLPMSASGYSMASRSSSVPQSDSLYSVSSGTSSISSTSCSSDGSKGKHFSQPAPLNKNILSQSNHSSEDDSVFIQELSIDLFSTFVSNLSAD